MDSSKIKEKAGRLWKKVRKVPEQLTLEPVMLLDGIAFSVAIVYVENIQMDKICSVNLNFTKEICANLSAYPEENLEHQKAFSDFGMWYGVVTAILPLFFVLFVGAWSDKYGRKPPLIAVAVGHWLWASCYLLNSYFMSWPVEMLFIAAILDTMGGGTVSFLTACNAYISDVTEESERTSRVGLANSVWFLGGPMGTFLGANLFKIGGYYAIFGTSMACYAIVFIYLFRLPESRGPYSQYDNKGQRINRKKIAEDTKKYSESDKEKKEEQNNNNNTASEGTENVTVRQMLRDLVDYQRIVDAFQATFKKREGNARAFVLLLIVCNLLRRLGRGAYMYLFTKRVLDWGPTDYGIWVSYKNLVSALGSLVAVPVLSIRVGLSDNLLALIGALASVSDYTLYALISHSRQFFIWLAPIGGLLVNSLVIAIRSLLSKFVAGDEVGKVSAMMGALDGVMPMVSFSLYNFVYKASVDQFPGAQFIFGAGVNILCMFIFLFIIFMTKSKSYSIEDLNPEEPKKAVILNSFKDLTNGKNFEAPTEAMDNHSRLVVGMLSSENFHIASSLHRRPKVRPVNSFSGRTSVSTIFANSLSSERFSDRVDFTAFSNDFTKMTVETNKDWLFVRSCGSESKHPPLTLSVSAPVNPCLPFGSSNDKKVSNLGKNEFSYNETESETKSMDRSSQNTRKEDQCIVPV